MERKTLTSTTRKVQDRRGVLVERVLRKDMRGVLLSEFHESRGLALLGSVLVKVRAVGSGNVAVGMVGVSGMGVVVVGAVGAVRVSVGMGRHDSNLRLLRAEVASGC